MPRKLFNSGFTNWTPDRLPDLAGKRYLITGGNSGIGLEAATILGNAGADIVIAARNADKGRKTVDALARTAGGAVDLIPLDLSNMASIRAAADTAHQRFDKLDGFINNAGIMQTPQMTTADGFELQFGTNHLGHFLLSGLMFDLVEKAAGRIVTVSSVAHRFGEIHFDDLMLTNGYTPTKAYGQSKLANLMFALELNRRLERAGSAVTSYACHPGYSNTRLQSTGPRGGWKALYSFTNTLLAQSAEKGAIPTVLCAAGTEAKPGGYYGPQGWSEMRGAVSDAAVTRAASSEADAARLWAESERLVGFNWEPILKAAA